MSIGSSLIWKRVLLAAGLTWSVFASVTVLLTYFGAEEANTDIATLQNTYDARVEGLLAQNDENLSRIAGLEDQLKTATDRVLALQIETLQRDSSYLEMREAYAAAEKDLAAKAAEISALEVARVDLQAQMDRILTETDTKTRMSGDLIETIDILGARLAEIGEQHRQLSENYALISAQNEALQTELKLSEQFKERMYTRLEDAIHFSMTDLESMLKRSGTDVDAVLQAIRREYSGEGGPWMPDLDSGPEDFIPEATQSRFNQILSDMDRMHMLKIAADNMPLRHPVRSAYRYTSGFGVRTDPISGGRKAHKGLDFAARRGTPIYATGNGVVIFAGTQNGYGRVVKIRHDFGYETVYAHLNKIRVRNGQHVTTTTRIGDMGNTGRSTGVHLHYEIRKDGKHINPMTQIRAAQNVL